MTVKKRFEHWLPKKIRFAAIVIYPYMLFAQKEEDVSERLMNHEMKHVEQVKQVGWFCYYASYLLYWVAGLFRFRDPFEAYSEIPYEIEAREAEIP